jgi:hypothetical protein
MFIPVSIYPDYSSKVISPVNYQKGRGEVIGGE